MNDQELRIADAAFLVGRAIAMVEQALVVMRVTPAEGQETMLHCNAIMKLLFPIEEPELKED